MWADLGLYVECYDCHLVSDVKRVAGLAAGQMLDPCCIFVGEPVVIAPL